MKLPPVFIAYYIEKIDNSLPKKQPMSEDTYNNLSSYEEKFYPSGKYQEYLDTFYRNQMMVSRMDNQYQKCAIDSDDKEHYLNILKIESNPLFIKWIPNSLELIALLKLKWENIK